MEISALLLTYKEEEQNPKKTIAANYIPIFCAGILVHPGPGQLGGKVRIRKEGGKFLLKYEETEDNIEVKTETENVTKIVIIKEPILDRRLLVIIIFELLTVQLIAIIWISSKLS